MNKTQRHISKLVREAQGDFGDIIQSMPTKAKTPAQKSLQRKHGTPRQFAEAVVSAVGEISVLEAMVAIKRYRDEWIAA